MSVHVTNCLSAIEAIKSESKTAPPLQQFIDEAPPDEPVVKSRAGRQSKKPKKSVKDGLSTSSLSVALPSAADGELLHVDPKNHRRKRRKTSSPTDEKPKSTKDALRISPMAQRRPQPTDSSSGTTANALVVDDLVTKAIEFLPEQDVGKTWPNLREPEPRISDLQRIGTSKTVEAGETKGDDPQTIVDDGPESKGREVPTTSPIQSKAKKVLHFNLKTGTIGSPPAKKITPAGKAKTKPGSNTRARQPKSKLVTIRYRQDEALGLPVPIGLQIDQILKGTRRIVSAPKKKVPLAPTIATPPKVKTPKKTKPSATITSKSPAALHPFFSGKSKSKHSVTTNTAKGKVTAILPNQESRDMGRPTLGSSRKHLSPSKPRPSAFNGFSGFGTSGKIMKFPGAIEPAWPWKDMVHIRGNATVLKDEQALVKDIVGSRSKSKKLKYAAIEISAEEDTIRTFAADLGIGQVLRSIRDTNPDDYPQLPS